MHNGELVKRLLNGSRNIDRMREETLQLVAMVTGYAKKVERSGPSIQRVEGVGCSWRITDHINGPQVECEDRLGGVLFESGKVTPTDGVEKVYESLWALVNCARTMYPGIGQAWQPLIDASYVKMT